MVREAAAARMGRRFVCKSGAEEDEEGRGGSGGGEGRARKEGAGKRGAMFIERLLPAPSLPSSLSALAP